MLLKEGKLNKGGKLNKEGKLRGGKIKEGKINKEGKTIFGVFIFFILIVSFIPFAYAIPMTKIFEAPQPILLQEERAGPNGIFTPEKQLFLLGIPPRFYVSENNPDYLDGVFIISFFDECLPEDLTMDFFLQKINNQNSLEEEREWVGGIPFRKIALAKGFPQKAKQVYIESLGLKTNEVTTCFAKKESLISGKSIRFLLKGDIDLSKIGFDYIQLLGQSGLREQIMGAIKKSMQEQEIGKGVFGGINLDSEELFGKGIGTSEETSFILEMFISSTKPIIYDTHPYSPDAISLSVVEGSVFTAKGEPLSEDVINIRQTEEDYIFTTKYGLETYELSQDLTNQIIISIGRQIKKQFTEEDIGNYNLIVEIGYKGSVLTTIKKEFSVKSMTEEQKKFEKRKIDFKSPTKKCIPEWECGEWSPCSLKWNFFGFIQNNIKKYFSPMQYITCYDKNNCESQKISLKRNCISKEVFSVVRKKTSMEIYEGKNKVASVFLSEVPGETIKIDLKGI